jgi:hypothetical protein
MRIFFLIALLISASFSTHAQTKFPMGNGLDKWGLPIKVPDSELSLRLGARYQSLATYKVEEKEDSGEKIISQDFQSRRVRLQLQAELANLGYFKMDLRNDTVNQGDKGEQAFNVGDAFFFLPLSKSEYGVHNLRLYRAKVDLARTQTVSSSELLFLNRPYVADEAAQFVSHNRRATNAQLIGTLFEKMSYQLVIGDGIYSDRFNDATGDSLQKEKGKFIAQNFMMGGKLRFFPIEGWGDDKPTETYFGEGKHFSFGAGAFNTSNIRFTDSASNERSISRNLYNLETSAHYQEWFITGEYFKMKGVVENFAASAPYNKGSSEGWYVQGEKLFTNFHFLAPFARYEKWNRFIESGDYTQESNIFGVNWYLNGNRFRVSAAYQVDHLGSDIGDKNKVEYLHLASMWHF